MSEAIERFFESLPARAPAVLHGAVTGTIQIDLSRGNQTTHWLVRMAPGEIEVNLGRGPADAIWYNSEDLFERLVTGHAQAIAAVLRNESTFSGNVMLFLSFRRFFPDRPGTRDPRDIARQQAGRPR